MSELSREISIEKERAAVLFVDVQHNNVYSDGGQYVGEGLSASEAQKKYSYFFKSLNSSTLPNMVKLQKAARESGVEVAYTAIESLTNDGRDRGLDYKISGFNIAKDSKDGKIAEEIKPDDDEIVFKKSSSSPFISTNIDYILKNLDVKYLVVCGLLSDQCISSTVRDACDLGYYVTLVTDACTTYSKNRHESSIEHIKGYCRQVSTEEFLEELESS